jgi:hypothetical protein
MFNIFNAFYISIVVLFSHICYTKLFNDFFQNIFTNIYYNKLLKKQIFVGVCFNNGKEISDTFDFLFLIKHVLHYMKILHKNIISEINFY